MSEHETQQSVAGMSGTPKTMFFLGLASGIGGMSLLALLVVLSVLLGGSGTLNLGGSPQGALAAAPSPTPSAAPTDPTAALPPAGPLPDVDPQVDHIVGNPDAKVTLVEYSDFECPFCLRHEDTVQAILNQYPNDVRLVYRHYPLSFHPEAQKAAEASECAAAQGKFWEMHNKIFEANAAGTMSVQKWKDIAKELGLDTNKFNNCLDNGEMAGRVAKDLQEGTTAGVGGTPATFVNGQMVEGAVPLAQFQQVVQSAGASS